ncbi:MAG: 30S ribosomal protein S17 [Spirochaetaceae bacterium]|nr:30S ribosomal protein S17 [Spirochaetaceae bacterium]
MEAEPATSGKPHKRVLTGTVVSNGSEQSVVIRIARRKKHRLYKKYRTLTKKVMAHDPANDCRVGDLVRVVESRPLSRMKRWRLVEIVKRGS